MIRLVEVGSSRSLAAVERADSRASSSFQSDPNGVTPMTDLSWGARLQQTSLTARDRFDPTAPGAFFFDLQAINSGSLLVGIAASAPGECDKFARNMQLLLLDQQFLARIGLAVPHDVHPQVVRQRRVD